MWVESGLDCEWFLAGEEERRGRGNREVGRVLGLLRKVRRSGEVRG